MDTDLIKRTSRIRYLNQAAKLTARESHLAQLILTTQGGSWQVSQELIAFLSVELLGDTTVLLDMFDNPVTVDRQQLLQECVATYTQVMKDWAATIETINEQR